MSYIKIWVHVVWTTKNHKPLLSKDIRQDIFKHINENASKKKHNKIQFGYFIDFLLYISKQNWKLLFSFSND